MIDLKAFIGAEAGQAYQAKLTVAIVSGRGDAHMEAISATDVQLIGEAKLPVQGIIDFSMHFRVTGDGTGEADFMGYTFPALIEEKGDHVLFRLGKEHQHRVELMPKGGGELFIKADLKERPKIRLSLMPID